MIIFLSGGFLFCCAGSYISTLVEKKLKFAGAESLVWLLCVVFFGFLAWYGVPFGLDIIRGKYGS